MTTRPTNNAEAIDIIASHASENPDLRILLQRTLYMKDFGAFVRDAWKIIEPGTPYSHNWHIDFLSEELMALCIEYLGEVFPTVDRDKIRKKTKNRLNINVPTRTMKTLLVSVFFPCWLALHVNTIKIATISYSDELSRQINRQRREIINSQWYQTYFGDIVKIKDGMDRQDLFELVSLGMMFSTSVNGTFTGKGADIIILDDIQKPIDMYSETQRMQAILFLKETLPTRLNNQNTGKIINIQQRLHYQDVTGYIEEHLSSLYDFIRIPLEAKENLTFKGKLTGKVWKMKKGDILWEARMGRDQVDALRLQLGTMAFEAQQQQDPTPEGGNIVQSSWLLTYDATPHEYISKIKELNPDRFAQCQLIFSWDMNFKVAKDSDFVGCLVGMYDNTTDTLYVVDYLKERLTFLQVLAKVDVMHERWSMYGLPISHIVEEKANGSAIIEVMQQKIAGIIAYDPGNQDKVTRMKVVTPYIESGHVRIPNVNKVDWGTALIHDLVKFPFIEHDDIPDAFSQLLTRAFVSKKKRKAYNIF
jgi:predicted phage terminase large subunit-like protein